MNSIDKILKDELKIIRNSGLYKNEQIIESAQSSTIMVNGNQVINFCANNYLGLSNHPQLVRSAKDALEKWGFGLSSVRFICGTQSIHKILENKISDFLSKEDTILYTSCFDANGGLFETLLKENDCIISDALNHASIIDGENELNYEFSSFINKNEFIFPKQFSISVRSSENFEATVDYSKIVFNEKQKLPFKIPSSYAKVE